MPAPVFVVRSTVADPAKRTAFDKWYQNKLLPAWSPSAFKGRGGSGAWLTQLFIRRLIVSMMKPHSTARWWRRCHGWLPSSCATGPTCRASARPSCSRRSLEAKRKN